MNVDNEECFTITTLVKETPHMEITAVAYYSQRVLIGTKDGRLVLYDKRRGQMGPVASHNFDHRRKVEQILILKSNRCALVLADGVVSAIAITDLQPLPSAFEGIGPVLKICLNQRGPPLYRVCVIMKRKLMMFEYSEVNGEEQFQYVLLRSFSLHDTPIDIVWYRNNILLAFRNKYQVMDDKTGSLSALENVIPDSTRFDPIVKLLPRETILVAAEDNSGAFINFKGEESNDRRLTWSKIPSQIAYSDPYVFSLVEGVGIEIHSLIDGSLQKVLANIIYIIFFVNIF